MMDRADTHSQCNTRNTLFLTLVLRLKTVKVTLNEYSRAAAACSPANSLPPSLSLESHRFICAAVRGPGWSRYGLMVVCVSKQALSAYEWSVCACLLTSVAMLWLEPLSNKNCTTSMWFSCAAMYSGVKPFWKENRESDLQSWPWGLTLKTIKPFILTLDGTSK